MRKTFKRIKAISPSYITAEMHINGDVKGEGAIEVAGKIDGDVKCLSIKLLKGAIVNGNIIAEKAEIHGEVNGDVIAKTVACGATAKIVGDITHQRISMADGAYIDGNCKKFIHDTSVKLLTNQPVEETPKEEPKAEEGVVASTESSAEEIKQAS